MISFKQFLNEVEYPDLAALINKDCREYLSQSHRSGFLYRGMSKPVGVTKMAQHPDDDDGLVPYVVKEPRTDRKPTDMLPHIHEILDKWFEEHHGVRARSGSVFCYGSAKMDEVLGYGSPFIILPVGKFTFLWSRHTHDLYADVSDAINKNSETIESDIDELMAQKQYNSGELEKAIHSRAEIMVQCTKYYAFPLQFRSLLTRILDIND